MSGQIEDNCSGIAPYIERSRQIHLSIYCYFEQHNVGNTILPLAGLPGHCEYSEHDQIGQASPVPHDSYQTFGDL